MAEVLYINNLQVDLPLNEISLTAQINDIAELKDRQADYSNNIKLPKTSKNVGIMDMLGIAGNKSRKPYTEVSVKYVVDGIEIISNGKGVIKNTNEFYNLVVYDGNISITNLLGDAKLNELDFSAYDHNLTLGNWLSSFTKTDGYIYGLGKFYDNSTTLAIDVNFQNVSFYVHTLFDMIFSQKGYSVSGNFFSNADYKSRVISMSTGHLQNSIDDKSQVFQYDSSGNSVSNTYPSETNQTFEITNYTAITTSVHAIDLDGFFIKTHGDNFKFQIFINDSVYKSIDIPDSNFNITETIQLKVGDIFRLKVNVDSVFELTENRIAFNPTFVTTLESNDIYIPIQIGDLIGEVKQYDFVKEIMQHFGLIFRKVRNKNEYEFMQLSELLIDNENAEDWSSKYSDFINEEYKSDYGQVNKIKYKYDNEADEDQSFADGEFTIDDVNLPTEKILFTSIIKASDVDNGLNILKHWVDKKEDKIDVISPNLDTLRMFKINIVNGNIYYRFDNSILNYGIYNGSIAYLNFESIYYQAEIDKYYAEIKQMLTNYKFVTLELDFNLIDYYKRDFFKLKYFKQLGRYYYLNQISGFKKNKKTKVELIEVNEIIKRIKVILGTAFAGSSTFTGDLGKLEFGSMIGSFIGKSTFTGVLTKTSFTSFLISGGVIEEIACGETASTTKYHNGSFAYVEVGNTVYNDSFGSSVFNGNFMWYKTAFGDIVEINNLGIVLSKTTC